MHRLVERLKQRKIVQWALAYLAGAWVLYQVLDGFGAAWGITTGLLRLTQVSLAAGFFLALVLAWYHGERGKQHMSGPELIIVAGIMGLAAIGIRLTTTGVAVADSTETHARPLVIVTEGLAANHRGGGEVSPVGVVYASDGRHWLRSWGSPSARAVPGTSGGGFALNPAGDTLVFARNDGLFVMGLPDGVPSPLVGYGELAAFGMTAASDGYFYTDDGEGLARVPLAGGDIESVVGLEGTETHHSYAFALPGTSRLVFTAFSGASARLYGFDLGTGQRTFLVEGRRGQFTPSGHLVFASEDGRIMAASLDPEALSLGPAFEIAPSVRFAGAEPRFHVSTDGRLLYWLGGQQGSQMMWVSREGRSVPVDSSWVLDDGGGNAGWRLSPGDSMLAVREATSSGHDIWLKSLPAGPRTQLTFHPARDRMPRWSRDGQWVTFLSDRGGNYDVWAVRADGSGQPILLHDHDLTLGEGFWAHDGEDLLVRTTGGSNPRDILMVAVGEGRITPLLDDPASTEINPAVSPDGGWLAYGSTPDRNNNAALAVFVSRFPEVNRDVQRVSVGSGINPVWAADGSELFYVDAEARTMISASFDAQSGRVIGRTTLFSIPDGYNVAPGRDFYDVTEDAERFLMSRQVPGREPQMVLITNFFAMLDQLDPD